MMEHQLQNEMQWTGKHKTAIFDVSNAVWLFVEHLFVSKRQTDKDQKRYLEDRRPAANCDPYDVTAMIAKTTLLE